MNGAFVAIAILFLILAVTNDMPWAWGLFGAFLALASRDQCVSLWRSVRNKKKKTE